MAQTDGWSVEPNIEELEKLSANMKKIAAKGIASNRQARTNMRALMRKGGAKIVEYARPNAPRRDTDYPSQRLGERGHAPGLLRTKQAYSIRETTSSIQVKAGLIKWKKRKYDDAGTLISGGHYTGKKKARVAGFYSGMVQVGAAPPAGPAGDYQGNQWLKHGLARAVPVIQRDLEQNMAKLFQYALTDKSIKVTHWNKTPGGPRSPYGNR